LRNAVLELGVLGVRQIKYLTGQKLLFDYLIFVDLILKNVVMFTYFIGNLSNKTSSKVYLLLK
jgi:hypothetical protein